MKSLMLIERFAGPVVRSHFRVFSEALSAIVSDDISISEDSVLDGEVLLLRATSGAELDLAVTRLRSDCDFDITVSKPRPVYKETFLAKAKIDCTHKKFAGGKGEFARIEVCFIPVNFEDLCEISNQNRDPRFEAEFLPGAIAGIESVFQSGPFAGMQMTGVKVIIMDAAWHDENSSRHAFEIVARKAVREAAGKAGVALLEPVMAAVISAGAEYSGKLQADIWSRRNNVIERISHGRHHEIHAEAPLAGLFDYEDRVKFLTGGTGKCELTFRRYAVVPIANPPDEPIAAYAG